MSCYIALLAAGGRGQMYAALLLGHSCFAIAARRLARAARDVGELSTLANAASDTLRPEHARGVFSTLPSLRSVISARKEHWVSRERRTDCQPLRSEE